MIRVIALVFAIALVIAAVVVVVARRGEPHPLPIPMAKIEELYALDRDSAIIVWSVDGKIRLTRSDTTGKPIWTHDFKEGSSVGKVTLLETAVVFHWRSISNSPFSVISFDGKRWDQEGWPDARQDFVDDFYETSNHIVRVLNWPDATRLISYGKRTGAIVWEREGMRDIGNDQPHGDGLIDGRGIFVDARDGTVVALGSEGCAAGQTYVRVEDQRMYLYRDGGLVPDVIAFPFPEFGFRCAMLGDRLVVIGLDGRRTRIRDSFAAVIEGDVVKHTFHLGRGSKLPEVRGYTTRFVPYRQSAGFSTVDLETGAVVLHPEHHDDSFREWRNQDQFRRAGRSWVYYGREGLKTFDGETGTFGTTNPDKHHLLMPEHVGGDRIWRFDRAPAPDGIWPWPGLQVLDAVTLEPVQPPAIDAKSKASNPAVP